jgi:hypothetical protein
MKLFERGVSVKLDEALDEEILRDYIFAEGEWSWEGGAVHNYYLGDAIESVIDGVYPILTSDSLVPDVPHHLPIKTSIIGYPLSGKMTHAIRLKERFNLDLIEIGKLIQDSIEAGGPVA